jgi:hypothetical protein
MKKLSTFSGFAVATTIAALVAGTSGVAFAAETQFQKDHPRRAQVNSRLNNQDRRIHNEVKSGEISKGQAAALHKQDRQIRGEERADASKNGGHITKQEQRSLNRQENTVSREIGK